MFGSLRRLSVLVSAVIVIAVVIWVDVTTPVWQNLVIISGLVAGVVTFLLTSLFIDRFVQRAARRRWAPVTRLALTEVLRQLSESSNDGLGQSPPKPRRLPTPSTESGMQALLLETEELRTAVAAEHSRLSNALVTWWTLLSSIPDTEEIVRHTADIALLLDSVREASTELDEAITNGANEDDTDSARRSLRARIMACNHSIASLVDEVSKRLDQDETELSERAKQTLADMHRRAAMQRPRPST